MICHGIPDMRELQEGDIVNIDISAFHRGYHGDLNEVGALEGGRSACVWVLTSLRLGRELGLGGE